MKTKLLLYFVVILNGASFGEPFSTPGPPPGPDLPNGDAYKMKSYWLAPYVRVSEGFGGTTVAWFGEDGHIKRQNAVSGVEPGFVNLIGYGEIQGVNEDWIINLPREHIDDDSHYAMSGYITSTPDSRVFVHEYHPKGGWVAEDIYVHGKLANKVGPFVQHLADEIQLNDDGSASLWIWKDESRTDVQIVTLDTNGFIVSREDGGSDLVAPGGVLLHPKASPDLGRNSRDMGWIPGSHKSLRSSSIGFDDRYHLVDWDTGKQLWDISCPGGGYSLAIGLTPKYVLFAVEELYRAGAWRGDERVLTNNRKEWIRAFYAVNVEDGHVHARWQTEIPSRLGDVDHDHFLQLGDKLYYITAGEFIKLNLEDIAAKQNGWK
jgi:hypothetical protein